MPNPSSHFIPNFFDKFGQKTVRQLGDDVTVEQLYQAFRARIIEDLEVEAGDDQGDFAGPRLRFRG